MSAEKILSPLVDLTDLVSPSSVAGINSSELAADATLSLTQRAAQKRAAHPLFIPTWSLESLRPSLPLRFAPDPKLPPSPKQRYRSLYRYFGPDLLFDASERAAHSDFQMVMYIVDFSGLEMEIAQGYLGGRKGQVPFHPISMFLAICLRLELRLSWKKLARLLRGRDGEHWRQLFGFQAGQTPSASGLRYFHQQVMRPEVFDNLCCRLVTLLRQSGLVPTESTYPGDPVGRGITVTQDGMLHQARHSDCCQLATDECFRPVSESPHPARSAIAESGEVTPISLTTLASSQPTSLPTAEEQSGSPAKATGIADPASRRPCRARQYGWEGCSCDTSECAQRCRRASRLDPDARFQHYSGDNDKHGKHGKHREAKSSGQAANQSGASTASAKEQGRSRGINCFGYRSVADRQPDDRFAVAWTLQSRGDSATTDERTIFKSRLKSLQVKYPDQKIGEWLDDSGVGYDECLMSVYDLGALRMIDIRAASQDDDKAACLRRGYDGQGRPLCPFGYPLRSNGYDYAAQRAKYVCAGVCRRQPRQEGDPVTPVKDCPYLPKLGDSRSLGQTVNIGRTMLDGSSRLARDIPYGSAAWKARYGRRNNSESRNAQLEAMGLKRMISHGIDHINRDLQLADFILDLRTVGRLAREATDLQQRG